MPHFQILPYKQSNFDQLVELVTQFQEYIVSIDTSGSQINFKSSQDAKAYTNKLIDDANQMNGVVYLAKSEEKLFGFITGVIVDHQNDTLHKLTHKPETEGWIGVVFVTENFRNKGMGQALISKIKDHFKTANCKSVRLLVDASNTQALAAYHRLGFKPYEHKLKLSLN